MLLWCKITPGVIIGFSGLRHSCNYRYNYALDYLTVEKNLCSWLVLLSLIWGNGWTSPQFRHMTLEKPHFVSGIFMVSKWQGRRTTSMLAFCNKANRWLLVGGQEAQGLWTRKPGSSSSKSQGLQWWLRGQECLVFSQRTWAWSPVPTAAGSEPPQTPALGDRTPSSRHQWAPALTCILPCRGTHN